MGYNPMMDALGMGMGQQPTSQQIINPQLVQIRDMINSVRMAANPYMAMQQMILNDPRFQQVSNYVNSHGGNAKAAFYQLAQEKGVDPQTVLSQIPKF